MRGRERLWRRITQWIRPDAAHRGVGAARARAWRGRSGGHFTKARGITGRRHDRLWCANVGRRRRCHGGLWAWPGRCRGCAGSAVRTRGRACSCPLETAQGFVLAALYTDRREATRIACWCLSGRTDRIQPARLPSLRTTYRSVVAARARPARRRSPRYRHR